MRRTPQGPPAVTYVVNRRLADPRLGDVYIGRPSKWGNPFSHRPGTAAKFLVSSREEAVAEYRRWIRTQPLLVASLGELVGHRLVCWCKPKLCHGDVLVELVRERFGEEA